MTTTDPQQKRRVTAADVRSVRFPLVRRGGYDPKQVDPFLEVIAQTLEGGPLADPSIDAAYIHGISFGTVRRSGYEQAKVDAFLDLVIDTVDPMDGQVATPPPAERVKPVVSGHTPARAKPETPPAEAEATPTDPTTGLSPIEEGQAHLDRLRVLHGIGVLSDKEVAVIAQRVKKRAKEQLDALQQDQAAG